MNPSTCHNRPTPVTGLPVTRVARGADHTAALSCMSVVKKVFEASTAMTLHWSGVQHVSIFVLRGATRSLVGFSFFQNRSSSNKGSQVYVCGRINVGQLGRVSDGDNSKHSAMHCAHQGRATGGYHNAFLTLGILLLLLCTMLVRCCDHHYDPKVDFEGSSTVSAP